MSFILEYSEEVEMGFEPVFFENITQKTFALCGLSNLSQKHVTLNAVAVTEERIRNLNREYRQKDAVTDILSFGEYADSDALEREAADQVFLGEIFFCPAFIERAAREDGVSVERELIYVFSHGILHLLGYDHSEEMFAIQDQVTDALSEK